MSSLDLLSTNTVATLVLLSLRVGGVILIAPIFSSRTVPVMVKTSILAVLSWLLFPAAVAAQGAPLRITPEAALNETVIGFAIGLGAAIFVGAAEAAGDLLSIHIGLSGAAALDPLTFQSVPVLAQFANLFSVALLLSVNAHLIMIEALAASLRYLPVGSGIAVQDGLGSMVSTASLLFLLGLRFAAPVLAAVLLANVALAILSRAAPQLNVLAVAFPIQIAVGLLALAASVPLIGTFFTGWNSAYDGVVTNMLEAMSSRGR